VPDHHHDHDRPGEWAEVHQLKHIVAELKEINSHLSCICKALQPTPATDFRLVQQGDSSMAITGVQAGASAVFIASLVPSNAAGLLSGPVFTADDAQVTLTPDSTNPFMVTAAVAAGDTAASFNLKVDGVNSASTPITHTFVIPILQAPPPAAVDFDLDQVAATPLK